MENFTFYSPTYFVFGKEEENNTGKYVKRFGGSRVLVHYGGGSVVRSGLLDRVKASLEAEGISYVELGGVKPNPRSGLVYEGIELCRKEKVDFVLAVGGGSGIDLAKAVSLRMTNPGPIGRYGGMGLGEKAGLPLIAVPTTAGTSSEITNVCALIDQETVTKYVIIDNKITPDRVILDPLLTAPLRDGRHRYGRHNPRH